MTSHYYSPSGRMPFAGLPVLAIGVIGAIPAAWIYGWLSWHLIFVFDVFAVAGFAVYLGMLSRLAATKGKARNPIWMGRLGLLIGLIGWYCQWIAFFASALTAKDGSVSEYIKVFTSLLINPVEIGEVLILLFTGDALTLAKVAHLASWAFELIVLTVIAREHGTARSLAPFSEASNSWIEEVTLPQRFQLVSDANLDKALLEANPGQFAAMLAPCTGESSLSYSTASLYRDAGTGDAYLSITNFDVAITVSRTQPKRTRLVQYWRLPKTDANDLIERLNATAPDVKETADAEHARDPAELAEAISLLESGGFQAAYTAAAFFVNAERSDLRVDANRLCALATSSLDRWNEAAAFWKIVYDAESTAHNALQVATACVMNRALPEGEQWLTRARELNSATQEMPDMLILTNFITALDQSGRQEAALSYLEEIRHVYEQIGVTDSTFLYQRHLPSFDAFLNNSAKVLRAVLSEEQGRAWYSAMLPHLDERGRSELNDWLTSRFVPAVA